MEARKVTFGLEIWAVELVEHPFMNDDQYLLATAAGVDRAARCSCACSCDWQKRNHGELAIGLTTRKLGQASWAHLRVTQDIAAEGVLQNPMGIYGMSTFRPETMDTACSC